MRANGAFGTGGLLGRVRGWFLFRARTSLGVGGTAVGVGCLDVVLGFERLKDIAGQVIDCDDALEACIPARSYDFQGRRLTVERPSQ